MALTEIAPTPFWQAGRGFLPAEDPVNTLPPDYSHLVEIVDDLPNLLATKRLRPSLDKLSPVSIDGLTEKEVETLFRILGPLASAYNHAQNTDHPANRLPKAVAIPFVEAAERLRKPPMMSYHEYIVQNWQRVNPDFGVVLENLAVPITFTGLADEKWFIGVHVQIEDQAGPLVAALVPTQQAAANNDLETVADNLEIIRSCTSKMVSTLGRMIEGADPDIFDQTYRPYYFSFEGVVYEGVDRFAGTPQFYRGESGAQSSIIPSLEAFMRIPHQETELTRTLAEFTDYMPCSHRQFIKSLRDGPSIRDVVALNADRDLRLSYNEILEQMVAFRMQHKTWAKKYIAEKTANPTGSGGTDFMHYLGLLIKETIEAKI